MMMMSSASSLLELFGCYHDEGYVRNHLVAGNEALCVTEHCLYALGALEVWASF